MKPLILTVHIVIALFLVGLILLQTSKGGLGSGFGGAEFYRTKRGAEKIVFWATIIAAIVFLLTSVLNLLIR